MRLTVLAVLASSIMMLVLTALAVKLPTAISSVSNPGPHGFSQMLYAYTSGAANNGSAFAGLNANTHFWNLTLAFDMFMGRFIPMLFILALAEALAARRFTPSSSGTFPTTGWLFVVLLIGVIVTVGGLTFFPALTLGPIAEHLLIGAGRLF